MIAPDANLLIYAYNPFAPLHKPSKLWLESILSASEPVGIPIYSVQAFLRFTTHPRHTPQPFSFQDAADAVNSWLNRRTVQVLHTSAQHWAVLQELCQTVKVRGSDVTDASIAALAIEYGAVLHTHDRDFARYPGLRWTDPLAS